MQAALWDSAPVVSSDFRALLKVTCDMRGIVAPTLADDTVQTLVERVRQVSREWQGLAIGGIVEFDLIN